MTRRLPLLLIALCAILFASASPVPGAKADWTKLYSIEVDLTNQIVTVYRSSDMTIVRQMICSTGTGTKTPVGSFALEQTRPEDRTPWYYIGNYNCYVKYPTRIRGPILFHSLPYMSPDMRTLDREAVGQLGTRASHGCIRLRWQDAKWIAKNCTDGTPVRIYEGALPDNDLRRILLLEGYSAASGLTHAQFTELMSSGRNLAVMARGGRGVDVTELQRQLIRLGFYSEARPSGVYDSATIVAVMRFQSAARLAATGAVTRSLYERIQSEDKIHGDYAVLTPGCSGPSVEKYQRIMKALGFYRGEIDGVYNDALAGATMDLCQCMELSTTDEASPRLRRIASNLLRHLNRRFGKGQFSMVMFREPTTLAVCTGLKNLFSGATYDSEPLAIVPVGASVHLIERGDEWSHVRFGQYTGYLPSESLDFSNSTRLIARWGRTADAIGQADMDAENLGDGVLALQVRLRELGFYNEECTPVYTAETARAVMAYQVAAGLEPDGRASLSVQERLFGSDAVTGIRVALSEGAGGPAVAALQRALRALQYYDGACDGFYDAQVGEAVRRFARLNGMPESAEATPEAQAAIYRQYRACEEEYGSGNYRLTPQEVETRVARIKSRTFLYSRQSTRSEAVATLPRHAEALVLEEGPQWCRLSYEGCVGYARTRYLELVSQETEVAAFTKIAD